MNGWRYDGSRHGYMVAARQGGRETRMHGGMVAARQGGRETRMHRCMVAERQRGRRACRGSETERHGSSKT